MGAADAETQESDSEKNSQRKGETGVKRRPQSMAANIQSTLGQDFAFRSGAAWDSRVGDGDRVVSPLFEHAPSVEAAASDPVCRDTLADPESAPPFVPD